MTVTSGIEGEETGVEDGSAGTMTTTVLMLVTVTSDDAATSDPRVKLDELITELEEGLELGTEDTGVEYVPVLDAITETVEETPTSEP